MPHRHMRGAYQFILWLIAALLAVEVVAAFYVNDFIGYAAGYVITLVYPALWVAWISLTFIAWRALGPLRVAQLWAAVSLLILVGFTDLGAHGGAQGRGSELLVVFGFLPLVLLAVVVLWPLNFLVFTSHPVVDIYAPFSDLENYAARFGGVWNGMALWVDGVVPSALAALIVMCAAAFVHRHNHRPAWHDRVHRRDLQGK